MNSEPKFVLYMYKVHFNCDDWYCHLYYKIIMQLLLATRNCKLCKENLALQEIHMQCKHCARYILHLQEICTDSARCRVQTLQLQGYCKILYILQESCKNLQVRSSWEITNVCHDTTTYLHWNCFITHSVLN